MGVNLNDRGLTIVHDSRNHESCKSFRNRLIIKKNSIFGFGLLQVKKQKQITVALFLDKNDIGLCVSVV